MAIAGSPELLIVMSGQATVEQVDEVVGRLAEAGAHAQVNRGKEATVIGAIGEREVLAALPLEMRDRSHRSEDTYTCRDGNRGVP